MTPGKLREQRWIRVPEGTWREVEKEQALGQVWAAVPSAEQAFTSPSPWSASLVHDGDADCKLSLSIHSRSQREA